MHDFHTNPFAAVAFAGLALAGALTAGRRDAAGDGAGDIRALYVTSSFPKDTMPIDLMVQHQLKMLSGPRVSLRAVVMENKPPWLEPDPTSSAHGVPTQLQEVGLRKVRRNAKNRHLPSMSVEPMDYAGIDDPEFLAPYFAVEGKKTLRQLYGLSGERAQMLSNFYAMTKFMEQCLKPENEDVDFCMYFDPDILMYQNHTGILELAAATFKEHPEYLLVSPPFGCSQAPYWGPKEESNGACFSKSMFVSSRHVILHRKRLVAALPFAVLPRDIGRQYWEVTMTESIKSDKRAQIMCGQEFFVVHPPSRYQKNRNDTFSLRELLTELAPSYAHRHETSVLLGTGELIRRFEAGHITATKATMYNQGCGCCADMMPSKSRIRAGQAFFKPGHDVSLDADQRQMSGAVNDAAFDWVVKCSR